jgi:Zn-dependent protease/predicted transcriptional regulator
MRWSLKVARLAGTEVRLHITFLLFLAWIGFSYYEVGGAPAAAEGVLLILALFGCVLLHEFGHALAARSFGIRTPDITLLPIGGVARMQRIPEKPQQELVVAIAGPLVNVVIAAGLIFLLGQHSEWRHLEQINRPGPTLLAKLASVNITLVLFNLIPAFPMDGGRVFRALLALALPYGRATQIAAWIGQALAFVLGFAGLFTNPMLIFIAFFIFLGAQQEAALAQLKDISLGVPVSDAMMTHLVRLPPHATLDDAADALLRTAQHEFPVVDELDHVLGVLTRDDMIAGLKRRGPGAPVVEFMRRDLPVVSVHDPFEQAFRQMQQCGSPALAVVDHTGSFAGLITPENVGEMMLVRSLRPGRSRRLWQR